MSTIGNIKETNIYVIILCTSPILNSATSSTNAFVAGIMSIERQLTKKFISLLAIFNINIVNFLSINILRGNTIKYKNTKTNEVILRNLALLFINGIKNKYKIKELG